MVENNHSIFFFSGHTLSIQIHPSTADDDQQKFVCMMLTFSITNQVMFCMKISVASLVEIVYPIHTYFKFAVKPSSIGSSKRFQYTQDCGHILVKYSYTK